MQGGSDAQLIKIIPPKFWRGCDRRPAPARWPVTAWPEGCPGTDAAHACERARPGLRQMACVVVGCYAWSTEAMTVNICDR
ncbi:MAG: hypothetical protein PHS80_13410 [Methanothrix sp.]|nr:hypothetical protein [Methanothrix sp.]MDD4447520.1 hypothetical protein [Methanothrix sp.]